MNIGKRKVTIVGVGYVGASIAYAVTIRNLARKILLIDIDKKKADAFCESTERLKKSLEGVK